MIIEVKKLFNSEKTIDLSYEIDLSEFEYAGSFPFTDSVKLKGKLSCKDGIIRLDVNIKFEFSVDCSRCADYFSKQYDFDMKHEIVSSLNEEDKGTLILVEEDTLDLDEIIISDIVLYLPIKHLCDENCKGICSKCGKNLNESKCNCKDESHNRWEALKQLLD